MGSSTISSYIIRVEEENKKLNNTGLLGGKTVEERSKVGIDKSGLPMIGVRGPSGV